MSACTSRTFFALNIHGELCNKIKSSWFYDKRRNKWFFLVLHLLRSFVDWVYANKKKTSKPGAKIICIQARSYCSTVLFALGNYLISPNIQKVNRIPLSDLDTCKTFYYPIQPKVIETIRMFLFNEAISRLAN